MSSNPKRGLIRRPSPAMAVAIIALAFAMVGTAAATQVLQKDRAQTSKKKSKPIPGPAGPAGANGVNGANGINGVNGADGTARAYARVNPSSCAAPPLPEVCGFDHNKGVAGVTRLGTGHYCVDAPGIDAHIVAPALTVDWGDTAFPAGNASAMSDIPCAGTNSFGVRTERQPTTGTIAAAPADDVEFTIVLP